MDLNELYTKARAGDKDAEKSLFHHLSVRLQKIANHKVWNSGDAEDIAQDALMYISQEYRTVEIRASFAAWACKVLDNRTLNYIKKKRVRRDAAPLLPQGQPVGPDDEEMALKTALRNCLRQVAKNTPRYARILNLHFQGYGTDDVCEKLEIEPAHAYTILSRARSILALCLRKGGFDV